MKRFIRIISIFMVTAIVLPTLTPALASNSDPLQNSQVILENEPQFYTDELPKIIHDSHDGNLRTSQLQYSSGLVGRAEIGNYVVKAHVDLDKCTITFQKTYTDTNRTYVETLDFSDFNTTMPQNIPPASNATIVTEYKSPFWEYNWYFLYTDQSRWLYCRPLGKSTTYTTNTRSYPDSTLANNADSFYDQLKLADNCLDSLLSDTFISALEKNPKALLAVLSIIEKGSPSSSQEDGADVLSVIEAIGASAWGSNIAGAIVNASLCIAARYNVRDSFQIVYKKITGTTIKI